MTIEERPRPYLLFTMGLSLLSLTILASEVIVPLTGDTRAILNYVDNFLCGLFFLDFLYSLRSAKDKWRYLRTWGWVDLISSIPAVEVLRVGRAARIVRILRVLRGIRSTRTLATAVLQRRAESGVLAAALFSLLLLIISSVGILHFETDGASNIRSAQDAIWWSITTITTVGYGDKFPVTGEGRILAALLMTAGVGLFGAFSGFVATWFLEPHSRQQESELDLLRREIEQLRLELRAGPPLREGSPGAPPPAAVTGDDKVR